MSTTSNLLLTVLAIPLLYILRTLYLLHTHYRHFSRTLPLPILIIPIEPSTITAQTLLPLLFSLTDRFLHPTAYPRWMIPLRTGWPLLDAASTRLFADGSWWHGAGNTAPLPAIAVISPAGLHVHIADPGAVAQMLEARDRGGGYGVARDPKTYSVLGLYGPCLSTAENADWPRHRKVLAAPFNESVMAEVWEESRVQMRGLVGAWVGERVGGVSCVATDLRTLSLNVLAKVGFRRPAEFVSAVGRERGVKKMVGMGGDGDGEEVTTFRDALATVLDNALVLLVLPMWLLVWPVWSRKMQRLGRVGMQLKQHMDRMLDEELAAFESGEQGSGGIMTALVRALQVNLKESKASAGGSAGGGVVRGLTKEECCGNIFIVNFAGHDTTANTLAFAALRFVAHPEVQEWVAEEIKHFSRDGDISDWDYLTMFPHLKRCQAVLLETLRLYPAIYSLPRKVTPQPYKMNISLGLDEEQEVTIPPNTYVSASVATVQVHPALWGEDAALWRPARWIKSPPGPGGLESEELIEPPKGAFVAWSHGPQNCPGQKFSRVEFVAVLVELLARYRLEAVPDLGEQPAQTTERVMAALQDIEILMLVKMRDGDKIRVRLKEI